ncbi:hypothetical protein WN55_06586 [Dufourea novaeangliae]|uniref:Uncharacterized protein n=1 Tax=Dufourea novaeangliae TaxID=178035 RepID=A0A154PS44_DUFNO|nr:hypothetical protein WN55_06586 [Dufourea novaeangliae]
MGVRRGNNEIQAQRHSIIFLVAPIRLNSVNNYTTLLIHDSLTINGVNSECSFTIAMIVFLFVHIPGKVLRRTKASADWGKTKFTEIVQFTYTPRLSFGNNRNIGYCSERRIAFEIAHRQLRVVLKQDSYVQQSFIK